MEKKPRLDVREQVSVKSEDIPFVLREFKQQERFALFYDLSAFEANLQALKNAFPPNFKHTLAVKANPLLSMLKIAVQKFGFGLECASLFEVELSLRAGCRPDLIMFDSPCKSVEELTRALQLGVVVNCDNFDEILRIKEILAIMPSTTSPIGLRINPLLGFGTIKELSVSDVTSKFGVALTDENKSKVFQIFQEHSFLTGLHVHVGSQGCSLEMLSNGVKCVVALAQQLDGQVKFIDMGGGLPTNFDSDVVQPTYQDYAAVLLQMVPEVSALQEHVTFFTEFGRSMQAKIGWCMSECEYVKVCPDATRIAVIHFGSDMFVRTCYLPQQFPLRVQVFDKHTSDLKLTREEQEHQPQQQRVVGPLCFGGDVVCKDHALPEIERGDYVVIRDAGANCLSLWSRHCSRPSPAVYGYYWNAHHTQLESLFVLRKKESLEQVLQFWE